MLKTIEELYVEYAECMQGSCQELSWDGFVEVQIELAPEDAEILETGNEDAAEAVRDELAPLCNTCGWRGYEDEVTSQIDGEDACDSCVQEYEEEHSEDE